MSLPATLQSTPPSIADQIAAHVGALTPLDTAALIETVQCMLTVAAAECATEEPSRLVLDGFALRSDAKIVRYPDRYVDKRGVIMSNRVTRLLKELESWTA